MLGKFLMWFPALLQIGPAEVVFRWASGILRKTQVHIFVGVKSAIQPGGGDEIRTVVSFPFHNHKFNISEH